MTQLGMDVEIVEGVAHTLQQRAQQIEGVVHGLDKTVNNLAGVWDGPDATAFVTRWWPEHRKLLMKASADVNGLASSVLHNADEQRQASSQKPGMGDPTPAGGQTSRVSRPPLRRLLLSALRVPPVLPRPHVAEKATMR